MRPRFVFPFAYSLPQHDSSRRVRPFQIRDGAATFEMLALLARLGWHYGGLLLNHSPPPRSRPGGLLEVPVPAGPGDRILTATRPPLDECGRKQVNRGQTDLEKRILEAWRGCFTILSRVEAILHPTFHGELARGFEDRKHIFFYAREGSRYNELGAARYRSSNRTAAFLLHLDELGPGEPGYIGIFAMDGTTTLIWAYLLRTRFPELAEKPGFVMAELEMGVIPTRTPDLGFAQSWDATVILQHTS
ncbi:MAG: hypothetical protein OZ948_04405 [Deltaproteobacteria bacterium]|nr:hypothetical protein [Deltaproteobacteria bacterium]